MKIPPSIILAFLILSLIQRGISYNANSDSTDFQILEERLNHNKEILSNKLSSLEEKLSISQLAVQQGLDSRIDNLEYRLNLYLGVGGLFMVLLSIVGYATIRSWIKQSIEQNIQNKIPEIVTEDYIQEHLNKTSTPLLSKAIKEVEDKGIEKLLTLDELYEEYNIAFTSFKSLTNTGRINLAEGLSDFQLKNLKELVELLPRIKSDINYSYEEWLFRGWYEYENKEYPNAIESFKRAIKLNPTKPLSYINLGIIYHRTFNFKEAVEIQSKAVEVAPNSAHAHSSLAYSYIHLQDYNNALNHLKFAIQLDSNFMFAYQNSCLVYLFQGEFDKALEKIRQAGSIKQAEPDEKLINLLLESILKKLKGESFTNSIRRFNELLVTVSNLNDSYLNALERIDTWFERANIDEDTKKFILRQKRKIYQALNKKP